MKCTPISIFSGISLALLLLCATACKSRRKHLHLGEKQVVARPEELKQTVSDILAATLEDASDSNSHSTFQLRHPAVIDSIYQHTQYAPLWVKDSVRLPAADSLVELVRHARYYGLFPEDYGLQRLDSLSARTKDTSRSTRLDAALWAATDLYLTSALVEFSSDLRVSRLQPDSLRRRDTGLNRAFYQQVLSDFKSLTRDSFTRRIEPRHAAYHELKTALATFLKKATFRKYTRINPKDSLHLAVQVRKRLAEDSLHYDESLPDSLAMATLVKKYQKREGLKADGKLSPELVTRLNMTSAEKFLVIAVNLDRYKQLPPMPDEYVWVNIPTYQLQVFNRDSVVLTSKVVVGKPETRTPQLSSAINNMMTYPQWTIPPSIISKDVLPALQRDPGYLARKGFSLLDSNRNEVDPYKVKWSRYKKEIPFKVVQGSGDDNALGVLKFNFPNKFSVYLHDTNQRSFFSRSKRALSHGCVRVESWHRLATYLLKRDSLLLSQDSLARVRAVTVDSLDSWLAQKKRQYVPVRRPMPVFLRYITAAGKEGKLVFYEDIYGEDRRLSQAWLIHK
jgi:murein L,D-transpeptidase YcbB/YkuD